MLPLPLVLGDLEQLVARLGGHADDRVLRWQRPITLPVLRSSQGL